MTLQSLEFSLEAKIRLSDGYHGFAMVTFTAYIMSDTLVDEGNREVSWVDIDKDIKADLDSEDRRMGVPIKWDDIDKDEQDRILSIVKADAWSRIHGDLPPAFHAPGEQ